MNLLIAELVDEAIGRRFLAVLRTLLVDRPFTPARLSKLRAVRDAERAWWRSMTDDDPTTLHRLAAIMSDSPSVCPRCGGDAYVCRVIGCETGPLLGSGDPSFAVVVAGD